MKWGVLVAEETIETLQENWQKSYYETMKINTGRESKTIQGIR